MNPKPLSFALDFWTLALTFGAGLLACWLIIGVWHCLALRKELRIQREAGDRIARAKGLM